MMEVKEVEESVKDYLVKRLNSPYFGSVITIWLITNRVIVFSLFNFEDGLTLQQKIEWVGKQFSIFSPLNIWGCNGFLEIIGCCNGFLYIKGFEATIVWSILLGFVVMFGFNKLNGYAKKFFIVINRSTVELIKNTEPEKWIEIAKYYEQEKKLTEITSEVASKKIEVSRLNTENEKLVEINIATKKELTESNAKNLKLDDENGKLIYQSNELANKLNEYQEFKVIYAEYGKNDSFQEVTNIVANILNDKKELNVDNKDLGTDPNPGVVKKLLLVYQNKGAVKITTANEHEIIDISGDELIVKQTELSKKKQSSEDDKVKLAHLINGEWELNFKLEAGEKGYEKVIIDENGKYFRDGRHAFNLADVIVDEDKKTINFKKLNLLGNIHGVERLNIINSNLIKGNDSTNTDLEYKKINK